MSAGDRTLTGASFKLNSLPEELRMTMGLCFEHITYKTHRCYFMFLQEILHVTTHLCIPKIIKLFLQQVREKTPFLLQ